MIIIIFDRQQIYVVSTVTIICLLCFLFFGNRTSDTDMRKLSHWLRRLAASAV